MTRERALTLDVPGSGTVSALVTAPSDAWALYVMAHGAGAGMTHPFLESTAQALGALGIATLRYQFPYKEAGRNAPDRQPVLLATVRAAVTAGAELGLPLVAGGKSMGGRMTSLAAAAESLPEVRGLAFLGFPLHSPSSPGTDRADHLAQVGLPMLFLQGTRDSLARLDLLEPIVNALRPPAKLAIVEGGDHSFKVPKRTGLSEAAVIESLAGWMEAWIREIT